ncbi:hypothetical protein ACB098_11G021000 [Castanea mollissima]|uniref:Uncharacterized protein n=1 Tax=Castanea mollissima TaxID=60419 RepID=A0A8J4QLF2_9ROSI|nr:hypothetical protein CMV_019057 [Castanea mollissima]
MATYGGSSSSNPSRMVTFITSDRKEVKVPVAIAMEFDTVRKFFDGDLDRPEVENAAPFPLSKVDSLTLAEIVFFNQKSLYFRPKFEAVNKEPLLHIFLEIYLPLAKQWEDFEAWFFCQQSDETIVKLVKAADFLENKELLNSVMPSFRKRFGLGKDKGVVFVYTAEAEAIFLRRAGS